MAASLDVAPLGTLLLQGACSTYLQLTSAERVLFHGKGRFLFDPLGDIGARTGKPLDALAVDAQHAAVGEYHRVWDAVSVVLLLCLPHVALVRSQGKCSALPGMLHSVLQADYLICLFRDVFLFQHEEWAAHLKYLSEAQSPQAQSVTAALKEPPFEITLARLKEHKKAAVVTAGRAHAFARLMLRQEGQRLYELLRSAPGLLGPKLPIVWAFLGAARGEAVWLAQHSGRGPKKAAAVFTLSTSSHELWTADEYEDDHLAVLVGQVAAISALVRRHSSLITQYFAQYLRETLCPGLQELLAAIDASAFAPAHPMPSFWALHDILAAAGSSSGAGSQTSPLSSARVLLQRVQLHYSTVRTSTAVSQTGPGAESKADSNAKADAALALASHAVELASWAADSPSLEQVLVRQGSLAELWWFQDVLRESLRRTFRLPTPGALPGAAVHAVMALADAPLNAHGVRSGEHATIGHAAATLAQHEWMGELAAHMRWAVHTLARWSGLAEGKASLEGSLRRWVTLAAAEAEAEAARAAPGRGRGTVVLGPGTANVSLFSAATMKATTHMGVPPGVESIPGYGLDTTPPSDSQLQEGLDFGTARHARREGLPSLLQARRTAYALVRGAISLGSFKVFNTELQAPAFLRAALAIALRDGIRALSRLGASAGSQGPLTGGRRMSIADTGAALAGTVRRASGMGAPSGAGISPVAAALAAGAGGTVDIAAAGPLGDWGGRGSGAAAVGIHPPASSATTVGLLVAAVESIGAMGIDTSELVRAVLVEELVEVEGERGSSTGSLLSEPERGPSDRSSAGRSAAISAAVGLPLGATPRTPCGEVEEGSLGEAYAAHVAVQWKHFVERVVGVAPGADAGAASKNVATSPPIIFSSLNGGEYIPSPFGDLKRARFCNATLPVTRHHLLHLGSLLGVRGWRVVSSSLLGVIAECVKDLKALLTVLKTPLAALAASIESPGPSSLSQATPGAGPATAAPTVFQCWDELLRSMEHVKLHRASSLIVTIGHALTLRRLLGEAVGAASMQEAAARGAAPSAGLAVLRTAWGLLQPGQDVHTGVVPGGGASVSGRVHLPALDTWCSVAASAGVAAGNESSAHVPAPTSATSQVVANGAAVHKSAILLGDLVKAGAVSRAAVGTAPGFDAPGGAACLSDSALQAALREAGGGHDAGASAARDIWSHLPILLAVCVGSPEHNNWWKGAQYSPTFGAWSNSADVVPCAVHSLLHSMYHVVHPSANTPSGRAAAPHGHITWLRRCLQLSAFGLLHSLAGSPSTKAPALRCAVFLHTMGIWGGHLPASEVGLFVPPTLVQAALTRSAEAECGNPKRLSEASFGVWGHVRRLQKASILQLPMPSSQST